jgi:hypothetical protein
MFISVIHYLLCRLLGLQVTDYSMSPDIEATWFIDPPYKGDGGMGYRFSSKMLDYNKLAEWVENRKGEVICCEGLNGDYLPFEPLLNLKGVAGKVSKELIYYRTEAKVPKQLSLLEVLNTQ